MPKHIHFSAKDTAALEELGEVGLMTTDMLLKRHYAAKDPQGKEPHKYCQRRLREFKTAGILESYKFSIDTDAGPRKLPSVHRLTVAGADKVEELTGRRPRRPGRSAPPSPTTLLHRVGVVRVRLAISDACALAGLPGPAWIMEQDRYPDAKPTEPAHQQFILREAFGHGAQRVVCNPDAAFLLELPGEPPWRLCGYLEYDRSSEGKDQIQSKLPGLATLVHPARRLYRRHWGTIDRDFARVLFVCRSAERIENISAWLRAMPGAEHVRLASERDLDPQHVLTQPVWSTVLGEKKAILHRSVPASS
jgi:hypothetical protein